MLCPSFYRADVIQNPSGRDLFLEKWRGAVIGRLGGYANGAAKGNGAAA